MEGGGKEGEVEGEGEEESTEASGYRAHKSGMLSVKEITQISKTVFQ